MQDQEFQDYLLAKIDIDSNILNKLFEEENDPFKIAYTLIELHGIDRDVLGKIWGDYIGYAYVNPNKSIVNSEYIEKVGIKFITENRAIPLYKFGKAVTVSTSNPTNPYIQDKMEKKLDEIVSFVFCFPFDIEKYLKNHNLNN